MSNYLQAPKQIIIDLINDANSGLGMTSAEVELSAPGAGNGTLNTSLVVTPAAGSRFSNQVTVYYNRLGLAAVVATQDGRIEAIAESYTAADVLDAINAKYNLLITSDDIEDLVLPAIPTVPGGEATLTLTAKAGSLIFTGTAEITLFVDTVDLEDAVLVTDLDGLHYPVQAP